MRNVCLLVCGLVMFSLSVHAEESLPKGKRYSYCFANVYPNEQKKHYDLPPVGVFLSGCGASPVSQEESDKYCQQTWRNQLITAINLSQYQQVLNGASVVVSNHYVEDSRPTSAAICKEARDKRFEEEKEFRMTKDKAVVGSQFIEEEYTDEDLSMSKKNDPFLAKGLYILPPSYKGKY